MTRTFSPVPVVPDQVGGPSKEEGDPPETVDPAVRRVLSALGIEDFAYYRREEHETLARAGLDWPLVESVARILRTAAQAPRVLGVSEQEADPIAAASSVLQEHTGAIGGVVLGREQDDLFGRGRRGPRRTPPPPGNTPCLVACLSWNGGVGRTTIAANLGAMLARANEERVISIDLDPRNQLGLHLGLPASDPAGLAPAAQAGQPLRSALRRTPDRVPYIPFGRVRDTDRIAFERLLVERPFLLRELLAEEGMDRYCLVIADAAVGPSVYFDHALRNADLAIIVLRPDAACCATLPLLRSRLDAQVGVATRPAFALLLNDVDEGRKLGRDLRAMLAAEFPNVLLPTAIHHDEGVREALALQRPLVDHCSTSQAASDLRDLAHWLWQRATSAQREDME